MLKTTTLITLVKLAYTRINENELNTDSGGEIDNSSINDKIENLFSSTKVKKSYRTDFLTFGAITAFIYPQNAFT